MLALTFLGTRGNTTITSPIHCRHSSLLVRHREESVMIDCGSDWRSDVWEIDPAAILLTHAHPDHAFGLAAGSPCSVYATTATWNGIAGFDIADRHDISGNETFHLGGIGFTAFPVEHSTRATAVGFRIVVGSAAIFYVPDVVYIPDRARALDGVALYVGDGATLTRTMVRKRGNRLIGHSPVGTQLTWCQKEGVPRALFTHCGSEVIRLDACDAEARVEALGASRGVEAHIATDGHEVTVR